MPIRPITLRERWLAGTVNDTNLFESHLAETVVARRAGGLRSKTKTPIIPRESPADFHAGSEVRRKSR